MIAAMRELGLKGMAGAFDEAVTAGVQRQRTTAEILTDLLRAEAAHRHSASIRYRMSAAKLPVAKDLDAFVFDGTPVNEGLVRSLHAGSFLSAQRNIVLVGGTGTGKTHLAIAITASVVRAGAVTVSRTRPCPDRSGLGVDVDDFGVGGGFGSGRYVLRDSYECSQGARGCRDAARASYPSGGGRLVQEVKDRS